jgi:vacuolar-type H+-ATPase subunit H
MAENAFLQVKEAEAEAQILIKNAREEAVRITEEAESKKADMFSSISETCSREALEKRKQIEQSAGKNSEDFEKETAELCNALREKLLSQKAKAVDEIIRVITE